ncbi:hypothetical protein ANN_19901 [Periplaneta americana]|uniref:Mos1 transposase HTH domain-containing protein n=1 Tax=Periplaneta americana TaxID=6978 RepID=A0ABQ8SB55_PERAM|nr:hypothetical protein ANN_19901 [Periplaneta americana]
MNDVIDNPADCEVRSVIRFLNARHLKPAEIYRQLKEVYGDTVMNKRNVRKWCEMFNSGRTNVHDETRPGRPSLITEDLKTKVNNRILQDRRTSLDELLKDFLGGTRFESDEELKKTVNTWLNELAAEEYNTGILKLVNRYDKCLNQFLAYLNRSGVIEIERLDHFLHRFEVEVVVGVTKVAKTSNNQFWRRPIRGRNMLTSRLFYVAVSSEWDEGDNAGEMSRGSSTYSYPALVHIGLRENPRKSLNQRIPNVTGEQSEGITVFRIPPMTSLMLHRCRTGAISLQRWRNSKHIPFTVDLLVGEQYTVAMTAINPSSSFVSNSLQRHCCPPVR